MPIFTCCAMRNKSVVAMRQQRRDNLVAHQSDQRQDLYNHGRITDKWPALTRYVLTDARFHELYTLGRAHELDLSLITLLQERGYIAAVASRMYIDRIQLLQALNFLVHVSYISPLAVWRYVPNVVPVVGHCLSSEDDEVLMETLIMVNNMMNDMDIALEVWNTLQPYLVVVIQLHGTRPDMVTWLARIMAAITHLHCTVVYSQAVDLFLKTPVPSRDVDTMESVLDLYKICHRNGVTINIDVPLEVLHAPEAWPAHITAEALQCVEDTLAAQILWSKMDFILNTAPTLARRCLVLILQAVQDGVTPPVGLLDAWLLRVHAMNTNNARSLLVAILSASAQINPDDLLPAVVETLQRTMEPLVRTILLEYLLHLSAHGLLTNLASHTLLVDVLAEMQDKHIQAQQLLEQCGDIGSVEHFFVL